MQVEGVQMVVPTAEIVLSKLGDLSSTLTFEVLGSSISEAGGLVNQTISGDMPILSAGREVLRLAFESKSRGRHLRASLALPSGETIAELHQGTPPQGGVAGTFASIGASYSHGPPPPVQLTLLGQAYGTYTVNGYMNLLIQSDARWHRADGTGGAAVSVESPQNMCCFCIPNAADQAFSRKKSPLGQQEVLMTAQFDDSKPPACIHLISDRREGRMPKHLATRYRRVVCELDGSGAARTKLDIILMGASLAALNATTQMPSD